MLVGNKGYRKFLSATGKNAFQVDEAKVKADARFDGKWVLQTDTELPAEEVALRYKDLLLVEDTFRTMKSILETRPIYHKCDDTIRGHVFCSFLALVLQRELQSRLESRGWQVEWARLCDDLDELQELTLTVGNKNLLRTPPVGHASQALQTAGVAALRYASPEATPYRAIVGVVPKTPTQVVSRFTEITCKFELSKMGLRI